MKTRDHRFLEGLSYDGSLAEGARNAVHICLRAQPRELVTLIVDEESLFVVDVCRHRRDRVT